MFLKHRVARINDTRMVDLLWLDIYFWEICCSKFWLLSNCRRYVDGYLRTNRKITFWKGTCISFWFEKLNQSFLASDDFGRASMIGHDGGDNVVTAQQRCHTWTGLGLRRTGVLLLKLFQECFFRTKERKTQPSRDATLQLDLGWGELTLFETLMLKFN